MAKLMLQAKAPDEERPATRLGGRPLAPQGTLWPSCRACNGAMQFLAMIRLIEVGERGVPGGLLLLFQCRNHPGECEEWSATSGGNAALRVPERGAMLLEPLVPSRKTLLDDIDGVKLEPFQGPYAKQRERGGATVLGQLGGEPLWLQEDETPTCEGCGEKLRFVVQLEDVGGGGMSFGDGGCGYAFVCRDCPTSAAFVWQE
jgi:hypothetical protein